MVLLGASIAAFFLILRTRTSTLGAALFAAVLLIGTDILVTPNDGPHGVAAIAVFASGAVLLVALDRRPSLGTVAVVSSASAGLIAIVDVFTMGTVSWVMTTALVGVAMHDKGARSWALLRPIALGALTWGVGYTLTWVSKWVLAGFSVGFSEVWDRVVNQVLFRTRGEVDWIELGLGNTTELVVSAWLQRTVGAVIAGVVLGWFGYAVVRLVRSSSPLWSLIILCSPALLSVIWFEIMQNHTQIHQWFAGTRGVGIGLAVVVLASEHVLSYRREPDSERTGPGHVNG